MALKNIYYYSKESDLLSKVRDQSKKINIFFNKSRNKFNELSIEICKT